MLQRDYFVTEALVVSVSRTSSSFFEFRVNVFMTPQSLC